MMRIFIIVCALCSCNTKLAGGAKNSRDVAIESKGNEKLDSNYYKYLLPSQVAYLNILVKEKIPILFSEIDKNSLSLVDYEMSIQQKYCANHSTEECSEFELLAKWLISLCTISEDTGASEIYANCNEVVRLLDRAIVLSTHYETTHSLATSVVNHQTVERFYLDALRNVARNIDDNRRRNIVVMYYKKDLIMLDEWLDSGFEGKEWIARVKNRVETIGLLLSEESVCNVEDKYLNHFLKKHSKSNIQSINECYRILDMSCDNNCFNGTPNRASARSGAR